MTSATLFREGYDLDELMAELEDQHPGQVRVVDVAYGREGGVMGFFARRTVGVRYRIDEVPRLLSGEMGIVADDPVDPLEDLLRAAEAAEMVESGKAPAHSADSSPEGNVEFARMLLEMAAAKRQANTDAAEATESDPEPTAEEAAAVSVLPQPVLPQPAVSKPEPPIIDPSSIVPVQPAAAFAQSAFAAAATTPGPASAPTPEPTSALPPAAPWAATAVAAAAASPVALSPKASAPAAPAAPTAPAAVAAPTARTAPTAPAAPPAPAPRVVAPRPSVAPTPPAPRPTARPAFTPTPVPTPVMPATPISPAAAVRRRPIGAHRAAEHDPRYALRRQLTELGVPLSWIPDEGDPYRVLEDLTAYLPAPAPLALGPGQLLAIPGAPEDAAQVAEWIRNALRLDPSCVHTVAQPWQAEQLAAKVRFERTAPAIVIVETDTTFDRGYPAHALATDLVRALAPDLVWQAVDASQKPSDVRARAAALGEVDALALFGAGLTTSPASVWELDLPVALIDGRWATRGAWLALLLDKLAALAD